MEAIHVFFANTISLATNPEITQPSTITVSTGSPETVQLAIANLTATAIGRPLMPGHSILLSVKLTYALKDTSQSASSYLRIYTDTAVALAWTQASFRGTESTGSGSAFFTADAKSRSGRVHGTRAFSIGQRGSSQIAMTPLVRYSYTFPTNPSKNHPGSLLDG